MKSKRYKKVIAIKWHYKKHAFGNKNKTLSRAPYELD